MEDHVVFHESTACPWIFLYLHIKRGNECDTSRSRQFPGVKRLRLTRQLAVRIGQITTTGHLRDVYRRMRVIPRSRGITTHPTTSIPGSGNQRIDGKLPQMYM